LGRVAEGTPWNALSIPQWLRIAVFANTIAICTSRIAYFVVANATTADRAIGVWNPVLSVTLIYRGHIAGRAALSMAPPPRGQMKAERQIRCDMQAILPIELTPDRVAAYSRASDSRGGGRLPRNVDTVCKGSRVYHLS
jgi:hypothetical protein